MAENNRLNRLLRRDTELCVFVNYSCSELAPLESKSLTSSAQLDLNNGALGLV